MSLSSCYEPCSYGTLLRHAYLTSADTTGRRVHHYSIVQTKKSQRARLPTHDSIKALKGTIPRINLQLKGRSQEEDYSFIYLTHISLYWLDRLPCEELCLVEKRDDVHARAPYKRTGWYAWADASYEKINK